MPPYECSECNQKFAEKYFDVGQNKCILHCHKSQKNGWYIVNGYNKKEWVKEKVHSFWGYIQKNLDAIYQDHIYEESLTPNSYLFSKVIFPKFETEYRYNPLEDNRVDMGTNFYSFNVFHYLNGERKEELNTIIQKMTLNFYMCTFLDITDFKKYNFEKPINFRKCIFKERIFLNKTNINNISFMQCDFNNYPLRLTSSTFDGSFKISNAKNLNKLDIQNSTFENDVQITFCKINGMSVIMNTDFNGLADFNNTVFNKVIFRNTDFNQVSVFNNAQFCSNIDFQYTSFIGNALFIDTVFMKNLNLRNTVFGATPNFLGITSKKNTMNEVSVQNRETARIIKSSFDSIHNIIEANRFYALEMKEREKELNFFKNPFDWLVFRIHGLSSNHSQDWVLALLWIVNFLLMYSFIGVYGKSIYDPITISIIIFGVIFSILEPLIRKSLLFILAGALLYLDDITLESIVDRFKEIFKFGNDFHFLTLSLKMVIAYLVYQFIVSIRQNTRRK